MGVALTDDACNFLIAVIAKDLGLSSKFPDLQAVAADFFAPLPDNASTLSQTEISGLFERLVELDADADTYFSCLASLHKARLKYSTILSRQPLPTMDQVGPRSLLQFGNVNPRALAGFLLWRKWIFDIDNRAGQETGYLFEPIMAHALGGVPVSASKSPVRRRSDPRKGRQVDCIRDKHAYEIKIRVTIAASGQGRWREELEFPADCRTSGLTPVLVVLDPTPNPKLSALARAFETERGQVHIGGAAWDHLEGVAGKTMGLFLEKYIRVPIEETLRATPTGLPTITFSMDDTCFTITTAGDTYSHPRRPALSDEESTPMPEDIEEESPGP